MKRAMNELATWDATETAEHLRNHDVSPKEVVEAAIGRAQQLEKLGAIVTPTFERALEHAKRLEGQMLSDQPFGGVPSAPQGPRRRRRTTRS
jgi:Asp-tRNA(Asn)/Glu-tRNA(Gln) amidotransferase A subunit family amidase